MLIACERRAVVIEPHTGADLPVVRRRDRRLGVDPHVAAFQVGAGRGPGAARVRDRGEVLVPARIRGEYAGLEFEPVVRLERVVQLHAGRMEVAVFAQGVVRRVWEEDERRGVAETGCIGEAAVAEECAEEQLGGLEPVAPAEVHEAVDILLMIVDHALGGVERHGEAGAGAVQVEVHYVAVGGDVLDLAEPEQIGAVVVKVLDAVVQRIEGHRFPPHVGCLPRSGEEEPPLVGVGTDVQRLPVRREGASVTGRVQVEPSGRNACGDVDDGGVLVAVLGVPATRLKVDLIHHLGIEQLVQASGDARGHRHAVHVIGVFGVLAPDVDLPGRRARRAHDRLLQDLRRRVGGCTVIVVLLEDLVARARVDRERHGRADLDRRQVDRERNQAEVGPGDALGLRHGDVARFGTVAQVADLHAVRSRGKVVNHVAAEGIGGRGGDRVALPDHAYFAARQRRARRAVRDGAPDVAVGGEGRTGREGPGEAHHQRQAQDCPGFHELSFFRECTALFRRRSRERARRSDGTARRASEELEAGGGVARGRALCPSARRDAAPGGERQRDGGAWPRP